MTKPKLRQLLLEAEALMLQVAQTIDSVREILDFPTYSMKELSAAIQGRSRQQISAEQAGEDDSHVPEEGDFHGTPNLTGISFPKRDTVTISPEKMAAALKAQIPKVKKTDLGGSNVAGLDPKDHRRKLPVSIQDQYLRGVTGSVKHWERIQKVREWERTIRVYLTHNITHLWRYGTKGWRFEKSDFTK